jgi:hypothetical protein
VIGALRAGTITVVSLLGKEHPNKTTVTGVLTGIAGAVASVTGLATATDALLGPSSSACEAPLTELPHRGRPGT